MLWFWNFPLLDHFGSRCFVWSWFCPSFPSDSPVSFVLVTCGMTFWWVINIYILATIRLLTKTSLFLFPKLNKRQIFLCRPFILDLNSFLNSWGPQDSAVLDEDPWSRWHENISLHCFCSVPVFRLVPDSTSSLPRQCGCCLSRWSGEVIKWFCWKSVFSSSVG